MTVGATQFILVISFQDGIFQKQEFKAVRLICIVSKPSQGRGIRQVPMYFGDNLHQGCPGNPETHGCHTLDSKWGLPGVEGERMGGREEKSKQNHVED